MLPRDKMLAQIILGKRLNVEIHLSYLTIISNECLFLQLFICFSWQNTACNILLLLHFLSSVIF